MDLTKSDVREITMSKYFNKKTVPYWVIAVLVVVIIVLGIYVYNLSNRSTTTIVTAPTKSASSEKHHQVPKNVLRVKITKSLIVTPI
ncbi:hypothetical protein [Leuconostoc citreum]|uniref:hypothetical protein n=1 Tax=Leuconostoc citreum TaxID=33964 RepID=UPI00338ED634